MSYEGGMGTRTEGESAEDGEEMGRGSGRRKMVDWRKEEELVEDEEEAPPLEMRVSETRTC
jgi:hypothetical protein